MKIGLYCGTFNPFHKGHLNVYRKAECLFERVILAYGLNPDKPVAERDKRPTCIHQSDIVEYFTLTTDLVIEYRKKGHNVTLIRGIRNGSDYDYEMNQINVMWDILPNLQV